MASCQPLLDGGARAGTHVDDAKKQLPLDGGVSNGKHADDAKQQEPTHIEVGGLLRHDGAVTPCSPTHVSFRGYYDQPRLTGWRIAAELCLAVSRVILDLAVLVGFAVEGRFDVFIVALVAMLLVPMDLARQNRGQRPHIWKEVKLSARRGEYTPGYLVTKLVGASPEGSVSVLVRGYALCTGEEVSGVYTCMVFVSFMLWMYTVVSSRLVQIGTRSRAECYTGEQWWPFQLRAYQEMPGYDLTVALYYSETVFRIGSTVILMSFLSVTLVLMSFTAELVVIVLAHSRRAAASEDGDARLSVSAEILPQQISAGNFQVAMWENDQVSASFDVVQAEVNDALFWRMVNAPTELLGWHAGDCVVGHRQCRVPDGRTWYLVSLGRTAVLAVQAYLLYPDFFTGKYLAFSWQHPLDTARCLVLLITIVSGCVLGCVLWKVPRERLEKRSIEAEDRWLASTEVLQKAFVERNAPSCPPSFGGYEDSLMPLL